METVEYASNVAGKLRDRIAAVGGARWRKASRGDCERVKALGECRRELVKDMRPVPKAGHEEQDWAMPAPIKELKACPVDV